MTHKHDQATIRRSRPSTTPARTVPTLAPAQRAPTGVQEPGALPMTSADLIGLQHTIGNRAVQRLFEPHIQRQSAPTPRSSAREYTVKPGDRLWTIAQRHLGDGERWVEITYANGRSISERGASHLQPGMKLRIPQRSQSTKRSYTIRPGDRLWDIAERELGAGSRWSEIVHGDGSPITEREAGRLQPGTTVLLPDRTPSRAAESRRPAAPQQTMPARPRPRPTRTSPPTAPRTRTAPQSQAAPQNRSTPRPAPANGRSSERLGSLSERYESGGRGPGTVSSGRGDAGGVSYGTYQMTSQTKTRTGRVIIGGRVKQFLASPEGQPWAREFSGLTPGSSEFSEMWRAVARRDTTAFRDAQHRFIERTHYDVMTNQVERDLSIDLERRSKTLRDVLWSTAVHHGPNNTIVQTALRGQNVARMSDADIIRAIYAERGRKNAQGELAHFSRNSARVQQGVAGRFVEEQARALAQLAAEQRNPARNQEAGDGGLVQQPVVRPTVTERRRPSGDRAATTPQNLQALMAQPRLSIEEIAQARRLIAQVSNASQRGDLYEALQEKVRYHSQRDNTSTANGRNIGDVMCNLTSLAMCLSYLGIPNPNPQLQYEDALEEIRRRERLPARTTRAGWGGVARHMGVNFGIIGEQVTQGESWYRRHVLTQLRAGKAVMMSITGHIVRLQAVTESGLVVDDPYGRSRLLAGASRGWERGGNNARGVATTVGQRGAGNRGEDHAWSWDAVASHSMLWIAWFSR